VAADLAVPLYYVHNVNRIINSVANASKRLTFFIIFCIIDAIKLSFFYMTGIVKERFV